MPRGEHNQTAASLADEARMEHQAATYELIAHDVYELATYEELATGLQSLRDAAAALDVAGIRARVSNLELVLARLRHRDLSENKHHRTLHALQLGEVPR